ncbi:MAG: penicillin-insensitive murein endopeptidase, partial [Myxococcota bacterium]
FGLGYCTTWHETTPPENVRRLERAPPTTPPPTPRIIEAPQARDAEEAAVVTAVLEAAFEEPYHPFLADERSDVSVSVGDTSNGYLVNARILPLPGLAYDILPRQRERGLNYGSDAMIALIDYAANALYTRHGRRLQVGNIGRRGGGDIPYSVSHNSGRDADIAFCYTDPKGNPVVPPDLVPVDDNGISTTHDGFYRFDTARTWTVVKAMLQHPDSQLQYLFISRALKDKLLTHARKRGASQKLRDRADAVLRQPGKTSPHNDHLHVRIYCSRNDIEGGCQNTGNIRPGVKLYADALSRRIRQVAGFVEHDDAEQRARAIERLSLLGAEGQLDRMARRLEDDSPRVRRAAAIAVGRMGTARYTRALTQAFIDEAEPSVQVAILDALRLLGGSKAAAFLGEVIADSRYDHLLAGTLPPAIRIAYTPPEVTDTPQREESRTGWRDPGLKHAVDLPRYMGRMLELEGRFYTVRLAAVEAAAEIERTEPVEALVAALDHHDPVLRGRAARALRRLTNHGFGVSWDDPELSEVERQRGLDAWQAWWERYGRASRRTWLEVGFQARGYRVARLDEAHIWEMVRAIAADDFLSYNAQRALMRLSDHRPASLTWPKGDASWHWTRWFERRRRQFKLPKCPAELSTFNR